ncbi:MAG: hypothetical protein Q8764_00155 [Pigeon pea little leaf phytoplasma]|uniref:Effector n=1 Tax=Candidatus Phytoplasma fabacearum TaxID=2982628 RepID=A0ABU8ZSM3_9MOLU|nr:hypothetical protein ['Bituminaria bituminosa' little leaf phytoplasma]MDV3148937.1 hypothetical protein [Pigeon pea little leaf phytoplasma]MDO7983475.1 hypothetical protein ['Bituminaria bituminosa' little leaf phytoplasma]MDO8023791.1 hypothetical protein ['Bituminaria bituminosa' little leaf phytoplasma]MDO8030390.1 hypothetical protein ['Bituminaria bituminosa' little leaf phytoplasma]MDV3154005.1 hypothetical protein [Pigeon pea little leaf phytoplasma]
MPKIINNIKKFFYINKLINILIAFIILLFAINYITLNSKFSLKANTKEEDRDILTYLTQMSNNPVITRNQSLLEKCNQLLKEYKTIEEDIKNFFNNQQAFKNLKNQLFDSEESKKNEIVNELISIIGLVKQEDSNTQQNFEDIKNEITKYFNEKLKKLEDSITFFQNINEEDNPTTIESLTENLKDFQTLYNDLDNDYTKINNLLIDMVDKINTLKSKDQLTTKMDSVRVKLSSINQILKQELTSQNILNEEINLQKLTLQTIINESLDEKLLTFQELKEEINKVLDNDTDNNSDTNNSSNNEDNFKFSSNNNSSFASKLFYLLCVLITVIFVLIIYQFNKKTPNTNNL